MAHPQITDDDPDDYNPHDPGPCSEDHDDNPAHHPSLSAEDRNPSI